MTTSRDEYVLKKDERWVVLKLSDMELIVSGMGWIEDQERDDDRCTEAQNLKSRLYPYLNPIHLLKKKLGTENVWAPCGPQGTWKGTTDLAEVTCPDCLASAKKKRRV